MTTKFEPFQKVLVIDRSAGDGWRASFFSHYHNGHPATVNGWQFDEMIPYEGNESLLGTTEEYKKPFKEGQLVAVRDKVDESWCLAKYKEKKDNKHIVERIAQMIQISPLLEFKECVKAEDVFHEIYFAREKEGEDEDTLS